jgi:hypothetical protein
MELTKSQIKTAIENNNVLPAGEVNLIDLREAVEEIRSECIDEFDAAWSGDADGTISTDLLARYVNVLGYVTIVETLPHVKRRNS